MHLWLDNQHNSKRYWIHRHTTPRVYISNMSIVWPDCKVLSDISGGFGFSLAINRRGDALGGDLLQAALGEFLDGHGAFVGVVVADGDGAGGLLFFAND